MRQKIERPVVWNGKKERKKKDEKEKGVHVGQLQLARDGGGAVLQCSRNKQDHQAKQPFSRVCLGRRHRQGQASILSVWANAQTEPPIEREKCVRTNAQRRIILD